MNPEFLREGTSLYDFYHPPFTVVGEFDERSGKVVDGLYEATDAPRFRTSIKAAEMIKYACNAFHALKVTFGNEIGNICKTLGIDSHEVMNVFCEDKKLNLSPYYLKPGFAFGGSCLPKDVRALTYKAKELDLNVPVLNSILESNREQIELAFDLVRKTEKRRIGILGLSFKPDTDDLRESPIVELTERLIGKGYSVKIYDKEVAMARVMGANKDYIQKVIPHISSLLESTVEGVTANSDVIVIANNSSEFREAVSKMKTDKLIIDLVRIVPTPSRTENYIGICW
jgi:GDP-mannose 6-dehydrogenase